jgi:hypothetical protein
MQLPNLGSPASAKLFVFLATQCLSNLLSLLLLFFFSAKRRSIFYFFMFLHFICLKKFS